MEGEELLGKEVRDKVSGFTGIVTAITKWLYSCVRVNVMPKVKKDGTPQEGQAFDIDQLEVIGNGLSKDKNNKKTVKKTTGGERSIQRQHPTLRR
jgi:hypothetical protein